MNRLIAILGGLGAGAALMYFMDPERGRTRRALIRDKATGLSNDIQDAVSRRTHDLSNRAQGLLHEAKSTFGGHSGSEADEQDYANGRTQTMISAGDREGRGI